MLRVTVISRVIDTDVVFRLAWDPSKSSTELGDNTDAFAPLIGWERDAYGPLRLDAYYVADALFGSAGWRGRC